MIMQLRSQFPFAALFGIATCFISTDLRAQLPGAGAHFTVATTPQQATLAMAMLRVELSRELSFTSNASQNTDYYLIFGPETDQIIRQYRNLTAHTPLLPLWACGLFQAKDRYISTQELVDVGGRYRAEHILSRSG
jgi:alpha-glucosidase (family GH31 glycosyl hydrolase)